MRYIADLHVHSRFSRATSRGADLAGYYRWARVKGIGVVGTGDFTHPGWLAELEAGLVEKEGLYALKAAPEGSPLEGAVPADGTVRFILTAEISSIYKKNGRVRKVHSLIGVPTLEDARRLGARLAAIGNVASDGRPILGLDPKDLLSILLETSPDAFLIPAHIWTPWFSLFGSKSGFDRIEDCFEELTPHIFSLETGLSSDPLMNWRWSALDRYRLISNSDAHSPAKLGREANLFDTEPSWQGLVSALRTGAGFLGTFEFYPEEGKYHLDGHRKCGVCMDPDQTLKSDGICPLCGTPVTVGVLNRVLTLADRAEPVRPQASEGFRYLIPLPELLSEIAGSGSSSKSVAALYARIITAFGSEYRFLLDVPVEDIARSQGGLLAEAVRRMREGRINPRPGYDGEFGVIRVFDDAELTRLRGQAELFQGRHPSVSRKARAALRAQPVRASRYSADSASRYSADSALLDDQQRAVIECDSRRSLVVAGPGTGKTRLLVGWIARHIRTGSIEPGRVLALTFTNRAAGELKDRLALLLPGQAEEITATTFHSFCWSVLRERDPSLITVYTPSQRTDLLETLLPYRDAESAEYGVLAERVRPSGRARTRALPYRNSLADRLERCWEGMEEPEADLRIVMDRYEEELRRIGGADLSSLVMRLNGVLRADAPFRAELSARYDLIALDEFQDINRPQYELLMQLCPSVNSVLGIGDPDQAIYGFRGSDRELFFRFAEQTAARTFYLNRNYRSAGALVAAADALITPVRAHNVPALTAVRSEGSKIRLRTALDPREEGKLIAHSISDLVGGVDSVSVEAARQREPGSYAFSDIAVLFRTRAVRDALLPALAGAGLPLTFGAHTPLAEEEPFRSLVAALRLVVTPADPVSLRVLRAHTAGSNRAAAVEDWLARGVELARKAGTEGVCALMEEARTGLVQFDTSQPEVELGEEVLRDFAAEHGTDLAGFISRVSLCARESERARAAQKVALLTFHAAKGLEFPVVFIAGAEEGITPRYSADSASRYSADSEPLLEDLEEERRLFYVALTRARDFLFISHCARRRVHGSVQEVSPSRFLSDIPARCRVDKTPRRPPRDQQLTLFR